MRSLIDAGFPYYRNKNYEEYSNFSIEAKVCIAWDLNTEPLALVVDALLIEISG